jgi:transposase
MYTTGDIDTAGEAEFILVRRRPGLLESRRTLPADLPTLPGRPAHGRKSFSWRDYRDLIQTARQQLSGPIVLVWDNLNTPLTAGMRRYIAERDWLTVYQLPPYAPDLNPVEGIWSVLRRTTTANRAFADPEDLITAVQRGPRQLQYRHDVLDGCLTGTGLVLAPP